MTIAVLDVETTGLSPGGHDRVVEVGLVVVNLAGEVVREFATLVNPRRDIGPTKVHGITAREVEEAPGWEDLAGGLLEAMDGAVAVAGHNVRFDHRFITAEFDRLGLTLPELPLICTMRFTGRSKLSRCCAERGIQPCGQLHSAGTDARMAAELLTACLAERPDERDRISRLRPIDWPVGARWGNKALRRGEYIGQSQCDDAGGGFLERVAAEVDLRDDPRLLSDEAIAYVGQLARVLEDRKIDPEEERALCELGNSLGLDDARIAEVHGAYFHQLTRAAWADGHLTNVERRDLGLVAELLRLPSEALVEAEAGKQKAALRIDGFDEARIEDVNGKTVCFSGSLQHTWQGEEISKLLARELSERRGMVVKNSVTKALDMLVVADAHTQSGKAKKARAYGTRLVQESAFWPMLGYKVD